MIEHTPLQVVARSAAAAVGLPGRLGARGRELLAVVYIDTDRIRASTVYPQVWQLIDLKSRQKNGVKSRRALIEYDCKGKRRRTLAFSSHSDSMAEGKTLFTSTQATQWQPVAGDTVAEKVRQQLCKH